MSFPKIVNHMGSFGEKRKKMFFSLLSAESRYFRISALKRLKHKLLARRCNSRTWFQNVLILGECFNNYFHKLLTIRTSTLSMRQVLSRHVPTNVKLTRPQGTLHCKAFCYKVIMEFTPISNLLVMIRLFR